MPRWNIKERYSVPLERHVWTAHFLNHARNFDTKSDAAAWVSEMEAHWLRVAFRIVNDAVHGKWGERYTQTGEALQLAVDLTGVEYALLAEMWHSEYKQHAV